MQQGSDNSLSLTTEQAQAIAQLMRPQRVGQGTVSQVSVVTRQEIFTRLLAAEKWEALFMS